jgi:Ca2+-binding RTX toxin-like protein
VGASGDDTFTAAAGTIVAADKAIDASSTDSDTLNVTSTGDVAAFTATNIETVNVTINSLSSQSVTTTNYSGVDVLTINRGDVTISGSTFAGNKAVDVNDADTADVAKIVAGAGTTTVDIDGSAGATTGKSGMIVDADTATGNVTVNFNSTINAANSTGTVAIDGAFYSSAAELAKASVINAAKATTVTTHADLTGSVEINAAAATTVTVADAQGGAVINATKGGTTANGIDVRGIDLSGATITTGSYATTSVGNIDLDGTTKTTDTTTISAAGSIALDVSISAAPVDTVTLNSNGAAVTYTVANSNGNFTSAILESDVTVAGNESQFAGATITGGNIDLTAGTAATIAAGSWAVSKVDLGFDNNNNAITIGSSQNYEVTADQTTGLDFDFSATADGNLTITAGDDNGTNSAVGTINLVALNAASTATNTGTVTIEASIANVDAAGVTLGAKQNLVITGDENVNLSDTGGTETVTADSVNASASSGIITINVEDAASVATVDTVTTGSGADVMEFDVDVTAASAKVTVDTGAGGDTVTVTNAPDESSFSLAGGNDTITLADTTRMVVVGGDGADNIKISGTTDIETIIVGGEGSDTLTTGGAVDLSNNTYFSISSMEKIDATAGNLTISAAQLANNPTLAITANGDTVAVTVVKSTGGTLDASGLSIATGSTATLNYTGSIKTDTLTGSTAAETFFHTAGGDSIEGGTTGTDTFSMADNTLNAAALDVTGSATSTGSVINLSANAVTATTIFAANSQYTGSSTSVAAGSVKHLYAANGTANSEKVTSLSDIENVTGGDGVDYIIGSASNNTITAAAGNDDILGGDGDDTMTGGAGFDTLTGGNGADTHVYTAATQGAAAVTITALDATNDFTVTNGTTTDYITGFTSGTDKINISGALQTALNSTNTGGGIDDAAIALADNGVIDYDAGTVFILNTADDLAGDNYGDVSDIMAAFGTVNSGTPTNLKDDQEIILAVGNNSGTEYAIYHIVEDNGTSATIEVGDVISLMAVIETSVLVAADFTFG